MSLALNGLQLGLLIGGIIIFVAAIIFIVVFMLKRNNKNVYYSKIDSLLSNIEIENKPLLDAYLVRLKNISANNESFVSIYKQLNAQYEMLMSTEKDKINARHRGLKERIFNEKKIKKGLLEQIKSFEHATILYKKDVCRLQKDLESYFKQGDELRIKLTDLQDKFHEIQSEINKYSSSIAICKPKLLEYLSDVAVYFDILDDNLAGARYIEAEKNLVKIEKSLVNVYGNIEKMAQYCKMVDVVIPNQLDDLIKRNNELQEKGYVVTHSRVFEFVENTKNILEGCKKDFAHLCFSNFDGILFEFQEKYTEITNHLNQEVLCKDELEIRYKEVSEKVRKAEDEFIKTKRKFNVMLDYYKMSEEYSLRFKNFESSITTLSTLKIEYEGLSLLKTKHPASYMLGKVEALNDLCESIFDDIRFFTAYFKNIKEFVENTYNKINEVSTTLSKTIGKVRKIKCKVIYNNYSDLVSDLLSSLKSVNQILLSKPIDIDKLNENFFNLIAKSEDVIASINNEIENYQLVSKCIVFVNPLRSQFKEVNNTLNEVEELFVNGQYLAAQNKLNAILNEYHPAAYDSFKG